MLAKNMRHICVTVALVEAGKTNIDLVIPFTFCTRRMTCHIAQRWGGTAGMLSPVRPAVRVSAVTVVSLGRPLALCAHSRVMATAPILVSVPFPLPFTCVVPIPVPVKALPFPLSRLLPILPVRLDGPLLLFLPCCRLLSAMGDLHNTFLSAI